MKNRLIGLVVLMTLSMGMGFAQGQKMMDSLVGARLYEKVILHSNEIIPELDSQYNQKYFPNIFYVFNDSNEYYNDCLNDNYYNTSKFDTFLINRLASPKSNYYKWSYSQQYR